MQKFADIILPVPLPKLFTYEIPGFMESLVQPGIRVVVPFGKKKLFSGIVYQLHNHKPANYDTKTLESVLDNRPVVNAHQFHLWQWVADYYQCTLGEVYKAALPSGLKLESESILFYNPGFDEEIDIKGKAAEILGYVANKKKCTINEVNAHFNAKNSYSYIKQLVDNQAIFMSEGLGLPREPRTETFFALHPSCALEAQLKQKIELLGKAPKQLSVFLVFLQAAGGLEGAVAGREVARKLLAGENEKLATRLSELVKKEILVKVKREVNTSVHNAATHQERKELSTAQATAFQEVLSGFASARPVLLHGVTSSGKTEIYIHLIDKVIQNGQQVLYLLPEIALTTQVTSRLKSYFGQSLGVYHSRFSDRDRVEVWENLLDGKSYKVIVGVRSAIFLPFSNLGLVIIDEEHEHSYKQADPAPRYHARDLALVLGKRFNANILLGTATPSLESYLNALEGKYFKVELMTRHGEIQLPQVIIADTRDANRRKMMQSHFTPQLIEYMGKALANKEQVILFQNRRGFSAYLECAACAWVIKCEHCDVSLTYHKSVNSSVCHYCGYTVQTTLKCSACGSLTMMYKGFGTQKIEEEIKIIFPGVKVGRMDLDTTRAKKGYETKISEFESGGYDVLVGTQMVTKGLDFERVSLVGILDADSTLNKPDFRAFERGFQVMLQVAGRAGRKGRRGVVVLQTSNPAHPVITHVMNNDFQSFYSQQLQERKEYRYPPFYRLVNLTLKHKSAETVLNAANSLVRLLRDNFGERVTGPQPPVVTRIQDLHLQRIMIRIERGAPLAKAKSLMQHCMEQVLSKSEWRQIAIVVDVDPL